MVESLDDILENPRTYMDSACKDLVMDIDESAHKLDMRSGADTFLKLLVQGLGLSFGAMHINNKFNVNVKLDKEYGEVVHDCAGLESLAVDTAAPHIIDQGEYSRAVVPLNYRGRNFGIALFDKTSFSQKDIATLVYTAKMFSRHVRNTKRRRILEEDVMTDYLTGINNKRKLDLDYKSLIKQAKRLNQPLSVIMGDIDMFKKLNDTYGHAYGDYVLKVVAKIMRGAVRDGDSVYRYGGEEFVVLLPNTDKKEARAVARRINTAVRKYVFEGGLPSSKAMRKYTPDRDSRTVRTSLGVLSNEGMKNWSRAYTLLNAADSLMYQAKEYCRDSVNSGDDYDPDTGLPDIPKMDFHLRQQLPRCNKDRGIVALTMFDVRGFKFVINEIGDTAAWNLFFGAVKSLNGASSHYDMLARVYDGDKILGAIYAGSRKHTDTFERRVAEVGREVLDALKSFRPAEGAYVPLDFACGVGIYSPRFVNHSVARSVEQNPGMLSTFARQIVTRAGNVKGRFVLERYLG
ncbi:MAG: diguanylate cyclase [Candidatus Woesearchaeota archaeon]